MKHIKDILIVVASISIIIFIIDNFMTKYNISGMGLSCSSDDVEKVFLDTTTKELQNRLLEEGYSLHTNVIKENTSTEKRAFTMANKSQYVCNTSIELILSAVEGNSEAQEAIQKISQGNSSKTVLINRNFTITENDLGSKYWVNSPKISYQEFIENLKAQ